MANHGGRIVRDSQRNRVYTAENAAFPIMQAWNKFGVGDVFETLQDTQKYVNQIINSKWWAKHTKITKVTVRDGRGRRSACANDTIYFWAGGFSSISLPRGTRNKNVILHELAHILAEDDTFAAHGPEFCKAYLALVRRFLGRYSYNILVYEFKRKKVKYTTGWTVGHNIRWNEKELSQ